MTDHAWYVLASPDTQRVLQDRVIAFLAKRVHKKVKPATSSRQIMRLAEDLWETVRMFDPRFSFELVLEAVVNGHAACVARAEAARDV